MIWSTKPTLELLQQGAANTLAENLGIVFTDIGDNSLSATMPVDVRTRQPAGILHGGASVVLAETLGSVASAFCIPDHNKMPVGIEINANHLKSVSSGLVTGRVTPIRCGKTIHVWNIEITNENAQLVCTSRLTVMVIDR